MFTISQAAADTGLSRKAIRIYEEHALIEPERTAAGYHLYTRGDLAILRFVRQARALGLPLTDIRAILDLQRQGTAPCTLVTGLLDTRIAEIDRTLVDLTALGATLARTRAAAQQAARDGETAVVCHIIEHADTTDQAPAPPSTNEAATRPVKPPMSENPSTTPTATLILPGLRSPSPR